MSNIRRKPENCPSNKVQCKFWSILYNGVCATALGEVWRAKLVTEVYKMLHQTSVNQGPMFRKKKWRDANSSVEDRNQSRNFEW